MHMKTEGKHCLNFVGLLIDSYYLQWPFSLLVLEGVCMWLGFIACTYYVWKIKVFVQT